MKYCRNCSTIITRRTFCSYECAIPHLGGSKNQNWKGVGDIPLSTWHNVVINAKARNIDVEITHDDLWAKYQEQNGKCALSGIPLVLSPRKHATASVDRIDSSQAYTLDNIQWVHKKINIMKFDYSSEYFIYFCKKISKHAQAKQESTG